MRKIKVVAVVLVLSFSIVGCADKGVEEQWQFSIENRNNQDKVYYAIEGRSQESSIVGIKTKFIPGSENRERLIQTLKKTEPTLALLYDNFRYSIQALEFNCKNGSHRMLSFVDHDANGAPISRSDAASEWTRVRPATLNGQIYQQLCK